MVDALAEVDAEWSRIERVARALLDRVSLNEFEIEELLTKG